MVVANLIKQTNNQKQRKMQTQKPPLAKKLTTAVCICTHSHHVSVFAQIEGKLSEAFPLDINCKMA